MRKLALCAILFSLVSAVSADEIRYTKFNIHVVDQVNARGKHELLASYANWTNPGQGHAVVPPNTKIRVSDWKGGFAFQVEEPAASAQKSGEVFFSVDTRRIKLTVTEYLNLITSFDPAPPKGLTKRDEEGVREGKALPGMTKAGVMTALGYPAPHETPSLEANSWTYWQNRFRTLRVEFDDKGIVTNIVK